MKKLQKLSALLLACAMVLLLFTACSGGSAPSAEAKAEAEKAEADKKAAEEAAAASTMVRCAVPM